MDLEAVAAQLFPGECARLGQQHFHGFPVWVLPLEQSCPCIPVNSTIHRNRHDRIDEKICQKTDPHIKWAWLTVLMSFHYDTDCVC